MEEPNKKKNKQKKEAYTGTCLGQNDLKLEPTGKQPECVTAEQELRNHGKLTEKTLCNHQKSRFRACDTWGKPDRSKCQLLNCLCIMNAYVTNLKGKAKPRKF